MNNRDLLTTTNGTVTDILVPLENWSGGTKIFIEIWSVYGKLVPLMNIVYLIIPSLCTFGVKLCNPNGAAVNAQSK